MKRFLLPASALVLVVTACGAGAKPAPRVTQVSAHVASLHSLVAKRRRAALREARVLEHEFVPPPGAHSVPEPHDYGGVLRRSGPGPVGEVSAVHRFWAVRRPLSAVAAFVRTHRPHGFGGRGATYGTNVPHYLMWSFSPSTDGRTPSRYLDVTAVALPGRTVLRLDAQVGWVYPRSPSEKVPAATRSIVVHGPKVSATVAAQAKVARIARSFDGLPVSPPGIAVACPLTLAAHITLSFRSAGGGRLAQASVPLTGAGICDPIGFRIGGKIKQPLIDRVHGESFVRRLQRLLGVHLIRIHL